MADFTRRNLIASGAALGAGAGLAPAAAGQETWPVVDELVFFTIGDWGRQGSKSQRDVARAMEIWRPVARPRFVMTVGDNFYPFGQEALPFWRHWESSFNCVYAQELRDLPWVPALGNHDYYGGSLDAQMRFADAHGWRNSGHRYYVHQPKVWLSGGGSVELMVIDSSPLAEVYLGSVGGREVQRKWVERTLKQSQADWKLVFGHHAVISGGKHGRSPRVANWLQAVLEDNGVQAYVCGHDHDLQHIQAGELKAPHYILTGAGSHCDRKIVVVPGAKWQREFSPGFTIFRVRADEMRVDFLEARATIEAYEAGRTPPVYTAVVPRVVAEAPPPGQRGYHPRITNEPHYGATYEDGEGPADGSGPKACRPETVERAAIA